AAHRADRAVRGSCARRPLSADRPPQPTQPLGLVLGQGRAELQLAARPRTARRARLRRRARGVPPRRAPPWPLVLEAPRTPPPRLSRTEGMARRARLGAPRVPPVRRGISLAPWSAGRRSTATAR